MTVPRWIAEAIEHSTDADHHPRLRLDYVHRDAAVPPDVRVIRDGNLATALIERLPIEAMGRAAGDDLGLVSEIVKVLTKGDSEVVTLTELYQSACRALDEAGAPYAVAVGELGSMITVGPAEALDLVGRIRWLARQRPTRLDLQRVEAERDAVRRDYTDALAEMSRRAQDRSEVTRKLEAERDAARLDLQRVADVLDRSGVSSGGLLTPEQRVTLLANQRTTEYTKGRNQVANDLTEARAERDLARQELSIERLALKQVGEARDAVVGWLDRERAEREVDRVAGVAIVDAMAAQIVDASLERDRLAIERDEALGQLAAVERHCEIARGRLLRAEAAMDAAMDALCRP